MNLVSVKGRVRRQFGFHAYELAREPLQKRCSIVKRAGDRRIHQRPGDGGELSRTDRGTARDA